MRSRPHEAGGYASVGVGSAGAIRACVRSRLLEGRIRLACTNNGSLTSIFRNLLERDGIDVSSLRPRPVLRSDLARASLIVTFSCQIDAPQGLEIERWDDMPAVGENFACARDAIAARVRTLVDRIAAA